MVGVLLTATLPSAAESPAPDINEQTTDKMLEQDDSVDKLASILESVKTKMDTVRGLKDKLKKLTDPAEKSETEHKIERINKEILGLQSSFEQIVLGGIDLAVFLDRAEVKLDWKDELELISRPIVSTLKEITAKPRQIEALRREIAWQQDQLREIDRALASLQTFRQQATPPVVDESLAQLIAEWEERKADTRRAMEIAHIKLDNLNRETTAWQTQVWEAATEFLLGRGFTLLLAIGVGLVLWFILKSLLKLFWRWLYRVQHDVKVVRAPLVLYSYRLFTAVIIVLAVLMVFYARGDVLLITLAIVALVGVALSLRQTLPRYAAEVRLLLGIGPVREDERIVYEGIPYKVVSLSVFSILRNPVLEGVIRLPLHAMNAFTSRQTADEPWFPCQPGDYILFGDGSYGKVVRQTVEVVEVLIRDAVSRFATKGFLDQSMRNLSQEGFGVACTFGIDYQHQAICLDDVPGLFRDAIIARFERAGLSDHIRDLLVEFKEAGSSSLDYQIYTILNGPAAKAYFKSQRLIQQACVETCNQQGWIIPFTQVTIHSANEASATNS
ncbi:MAG: hypothetical protein HKP12_13995 [Gammaproteobacteria bacterium]|nr:hypothetical protein [Gammaproteobacteria bacterium]